MGEAHTAYSWLGSTRWPWYWHGHKTDLCRKMFLFIFQQSPSILTLILTMFGEGAWYACIMHTALLLFVCKNVLLIFAHQTTHQCRFSEQVSRHPKILDSLFRMLCIHLGIDVKIEKSYCCYCHRRDDNSDKKWEIVSSNQVQPLLCLEI